MLQVPRTRAAELKRKLSGGDFDFRPVPFALFSVKGEGVVATFYESGKLVVQGANPELFVEHWIEGGATGASERGGVAGGRASGRDAGGASGVPRGDSGDDDDGADEGAGDEGDSAAAGDARARRTASASTSTTRSSSRSARGAGAASSPASARTGPGGRVRATGHEHLDVALIGSDECGKGDYFGPLVVAAVRLEPGQAEKLRTAGVRDSKALSDEQCLKLGAALRGAFPHAVVRLDPERYNAIYVQGKLNDLLGNLHAEAIAQLARPGIHVLVDQFANAKLMQQKLKHLDVQLEQRTRAEANPAVAAASIIAREQFLSGLRELSEEAAVDLHKGAGSPVDAAAERFVAIHGREGLVKVAKLHFKNTQKIRGGRAR